MSTGWKFARIAGPVSCALLSCVLGIVDAAADADSCRPSRKAKKPVAPASTCHPGPTGPVQQIPLDSMAPVPPQVSYQNDQLTIVAPNSTLGDILRAVRKQTGAEIEVPAAPERVVTHLGPGPAREVMAELLNGSRFNYVLLGSPTKMQLLTRVVLVAKTGPDTVNPPVARQLAEQQQPGTCTGNPGPPQQDRGTTRMRHDAAEENADDNADQAAAEAEQPPATPISLA